MNDDIKAIGMLRLCKSKQRQQSVGNDMHQNAKPPMFVPEEYRKEIEKLSKADLMDIAWDYAMQLAGTVETDAMKEFRQRRDLVVFYRVDVKSPMTRIRRKAAALKSAERGG